MNNFCFKIEDKQYDVDILGIADNIAKVSVNGETYEVEVNQQLKTTKTPTLKIEPAVIPTDSSPSTARTANPSDPKGTGMIKSPLPGKVLDIFVKQGDQISRGQTVICLEAMKMENNIISDRDGVVVAIHTQKGDTVLEGHKLIEVS
ncbi:biotin/lipoyl-containing protein [Solitalea canadensis]|uniref:Biotin carboxyl carrier protein n=1 Tax=Solitalea canadensis (strain ATCC 29591 / DSM 3403 / JCM 21819 / LMG 8368 / NBRC 15130 / NCIMB 12057 / USAM 9D) TaxID=929556 RepID=H8KWH0_SOLCM|nr:biotin/lipoyl-containing protein [Solitalea canadensis]AFD08088.1 biotin carboxyl carrier protein [Solitalea canadensis DSM 3403]